MRTAAHYFIDITQIFLLYRTVCNQPEYRAISNSDQVNYLSILSITHTHACTHKLTHTTHTLTHIPHTHVHVHPQTYTHNHRHTHKHMQRWLLQCTPTVSLCTGSSMSSSLSVTLDVPEFIYAHDDIPEEVFNCVAQPVAGQPADGTTYSYIWSRDSVPIPGGTGGRLAVKVFLEWAGSCLECAVFGEAISTSKRLNVQSKIW